MVFLPCTLTPMQPRINVIACDGILSPQSSIVRKFFGEGRAMLELHDSEHKLFSGVFESKIFCHYDCCVMTFYDLFLTSLYLFATTKHPASVRLTILNTIFLPSGGRSCSSKPSTDTSMTSKGAWSKVIAELACFQSSQLLFITSPLTIHTS